MMIDTRTPADLGYRPSPTRAERDTWRTPAMHTGAEIAAMLNPDLPRAPSPYEGSYGTFPA